MKNIRLFNALLLCFGLLFSQGLTAQTCVQLGSPVGELSPLLKSTPGVCPTPAQAISVCDCPTGFVATGYIGEEGNGYGAEVISNFTLRCRQLNTDGTLGATVMMTCANGTAAGNTTDGPVDAAGGEALVGFELRIGCAIDGVQGYGKPITDIAAGTANSTSNVLPGIGGMGGSPQPVMYVPDGNVIVGMQTYEDPGNDISAGVAWRYAPIETCIISGCTITSITLQNASPCNDNGTTDNANDDFFTADIVVNYVDPPATGTLDVSGAGVSESIAVSSIGAGSYTFANVQIPASGFSVVLTASFSANGTCSLTANAGSSPGVCSPDATGIPTMSEWGLILLALIMFTLTVVFGVQYQQSLSSSAGSIAVENTGRKLPFNTKGFFTVLPWVYAAIAGFFALVIFAFGYELTSADVPGSLLAGAIVAYLIHFVKDNTAKQSGE
jgi:hypothetical protein